MNPATILVVEDNPTNLKLVSHLLEFEGHRMLQAVDAEAALAVVAHTRPDLILMDIALPGMDGLALTRKLKAAEETRDICIVALSAFAMKGDEEKALAAGCAGYITKPIDTRKLLGQVAAFLAPRAASTPREATRILVVDDNETDRKLLCAMLQAEGLETLQAADGEQALAVLGGQTIDAIISDILMPRMDGFNLSRVVNQSKRWRDLPFIFYTASFTSAEDEAFALQTGADGFLHKPAPLKAILDALRDATRQTASPHRATAEPVPELVTMKQFNEHLVRSLEDKNVALNQLTAELEREIVERTQAEREARGNLTLADRSRRTLLSVIEDQKEAEGKVRRLNAELEQRVRDRTAELEAANQELEAFSYSVSHDLRAPLRHLTGFAELLQKNDHAKLDDRARRHLTFISESAVRMGQLIDDLLAFSRSGRMEFRKVPVNLDALVEEVIQSMHPGTQGRRIVWQIAPLPAVHADANLLRAVLTNLLANALKFTQPRDEATIQMGCTENEHEHIFFIRDNGVGFDMRYVEKLFDVFQRLHSTEEFEGTGIGLANVRRIISRHGGRNWAESVLGEGATFYFSLPKSTEDNRPKRETT